MATGSYDANGIWQYGEDDNIALFADTLNKLADSTSDAFTADRGRISTLEAGSLAGLIPVAPESIVVATGTAAVNALGVVSFTGATVISLNNVFTSAYKNYRFILNVTAVTATMSTQIRLRNAGADLSGAAYNRIQMAVIANATTATAGANGQTSYDLGSTSVVANKMVASGDIFAPNETLQTSFATTTIGYAVSASFWASWTGGGNYTPSTAVDGISFICSAGNFTGTVQVFGYND